MAAVGGEGLGFFSHLTFHLFVDLVLLWSASSPSLRQVSISTAAGSVYLVFGPERKVSSHCDSTRSSGTSTLSHTIMSHL